MSDKAATADLSTDELVNGVIEWISIESPSIDAAAVNRMVDHVAQEFEAVGLETERTPGEDGWGDLIRGRAPGSSRANKGILVVSHIDTVHPIGTKESGNPIRIEGDHLYGPGTYDMKAGAYIAYYAYKRLLEEGGEPKLPVTFMYIPEEERGSPYSRKYIAEEARKAKYVLVTEPARDGGKVVVERKGSARFKVTATGRPAHSGSKHEHGRSAIKEIAKQICDIESWTDYERGVTFNTGIISGGTGVNVIPKDCVIEVDHRFVRLSDGQEMEARMLGLEPYDPDVTLEVSGGISRPPMEATDGILDLFEKARAYSLEHGLDLQYTGRTGGGSDGNLTAAEGVPTLDGLGADGYGAHQLDEHIYISSLEPRARTWMKLFERLD
ncbi:MAG: M20 family metallopeptidase [Magnetovibrio sp.]|nr:M20 family metallopeptidase [Magnetovibrio sp.]